MKTALIGYTGFVGGNLAAQHAFDDLYNSSNIDTIAGRAYDLVVCSGARAEKWRINQDPETDLQNIEKLKKALGQANIKKLVLISTVDVYPSPINVDENTLIDPEKSHAYGRHRLQLEQFCTEHFEDVLIVRLPGLFGQGLKKNIIYDFLHDNMVANIHADSRFQFYCLDHIWKDIETALEHDLKLLNIATAPVSVAEVAQTGFGIGFDNRPEGAKPALYDFRSIHAKVFGGTDGYLYGKDQILNEIKQFADRERTRS